MQSGQVAATVGSGRAGTAVAPAAGAYRLAPGWVIVERHWEFNDEETCVAGDPVANRIYLDESAARSECQRLCQAACAAEPLGGVQPATGLEETDPVSQVLDLLRWEGCPAHYFVQLVEQGDSPCLGRQLIRWPLALE